MMRKLFDVGMVVVLISLFSGCSTPNAETCGGKIEGNKPTLLMQLPEYVPTPDAMTMAPNGDIILAAPNFSDSRYPGILLSINKENELSIFTPGLLHPETGYGRPMGLDYGPDGNLYYADTQYLDNKDFKSRLIRVVMDKAGKPVRCEVAVNGFRLSNAVIWKDNTIYVSDTFFDVPGTPEGQGKSGIFAITMEEMEKGTVQLKGNMDDPHLIAHFTTTANDRGDIAGADGMTFDGQGRLHTGNFGDGVMSRISFNEDGTVKAQEIISRAITCCDGIFYDAKRETIFITDSEKNAIHTMDPETGKTEIFWKNGDTDGMDGLLDQPCEPIVRGDELIVVSFDHSKPEWGLINQGSDKFDTLHVIKLK